MRTSQQLRRIEALAGALREDRGDTEWHDVDRARVTEALVALEAIGEANPRFRPDRNTEVTT